MVDTKEGTEMVTIKESMRLKDELPVRLEKWAVSGHFQICFAFCSDLEEELTERELLELKRKLKHLQRQTALLAAGRVAECMKATLHLAQLADRKKPDSEVG